MKTPPTGDVMVMSDTNEAGKTVRQKLQVIFEPATLYDSTIRSTV
jgi:hypothetical protein